jgi:XTP/dITP diphosphohydrolase
MKLLIATTNPGKVKEISAILAAEGLRELGLDIMSLSDLPEIESPDETGSTFAENALIKARYYYAETGLSTLADDSGLEVEALDGRPGVRSARYAGESATDADRIAKLLQEIEFVPQEERGARFVCAAALVWPGGEKTFLGDVSGVIVEASRGSGGFGYDPVFYYQLLGKTFGEMTPDEKSRVSHRGKAFRGLARWLVGQLSSSGPSGEPRVWPKR